MRELTFTNATEWERFDRIIAVSTPFTPLVKNPLFLNRWILPCIKASRKKSIKTEYSSFSEVFPSSEASKFQSFFGRFLCKRPDKIYLKRIMGIRSVKLKNPLFLNRWILPCIKASTKKSIKTEYSSFSEVFPSSEASKFQSFFGRFLCKRPDKIYLKRIMSIRSVKLYLERPCWVETSPALPMLRYA